MIRSVKKQAREQVKRKTDVKEERRERGKDGRVLMVPG